jgi:hypothetical protein
LGPSSFWSYQFPSRKIFTVLDQHQVIYKLNAFMRTNTNSIKGLICVVAVAATVTSALAQGDVVYDNSSDPVLGTFVPEDTSLEFGDQIVLTGDRSLVTEFRLEYFSSDAAGSGVVRFRANDGAVDTLGGFETGQLEPGTLLYESPSFPLQADFNTLEITGLSVPVPADMFTFTIEFSDVPNTQNVGLLLRNPPEVGSSFDDIWVRPDNGDWALRQIPLTTANLAAQVVAVPEPGTVALALIGIGSLFGFMRRRR